MSEQTPLRPWCRMAHCPNKRLAEAAVARVTELQLRVARLEGALLAVFPESPLLVPANEEQPMGDRMRQEAERILRENYIAESWAAPLARAYLDSEARVRELEAAYALRSKLAHEREDLLLSIIGEHCGFGSATYKRAESLVPANEETADG